MVSSRRLLVPARGMVPCRDLCYTFMICGTPTSSPVCVSIGIFFFVIDVTTMVSYGTMVFYNDAVVVLYMSVVVLP